jgi:hypothetical protein
MSEFKEDTYQNIAKNLAYPSSLKNHEMQGIIITFKLLNNEIFTTLKSYTPRKHFR